MKNPPILVSVLGFFVAIAGVSWLILGIRLLGFDWFGMLGDVPAVESAGLWGWLTIGAGILWILVAVGLWALQPWAWMTGMVVAGIGLFEAVLWMFKASGTGIGLGMAIMPIVILWYLNTRGVKEAFGLEG
jgi:hypothetical protein